jgi:hypothetical protein
MKIILKWIVGIIFLLAGVSGAIQKEYEALLLIPLGLFIIPSSYKVLIEEKANLKLASKTKWIVVLIGFLLFAVGTKDFAKNKGEASNDSDATDVVNTDNIKSQDFVGHEYHSMQADLSGEFMSNLDLSKFKIYEVEVHNETELDDKKKDSIYEFVAYGDIRGYNQTEPKGSVMKSVDWETDYGFVDSNNYNVKGIYYTNNVYDKKPKCTYKIISVRRFISANEGNKSNSSYIYPRDLLELCK